MLFTQGAAMPLHNHQEHVFTEGAAMPLHTHQEHMFTEGAAMSHPYLSWLDSLEDDIEPHSKTVPG